MAREDNDLGNLSGWDADREWQNFISLDPPKRHFGPRDWSPSDNDADFDPATLPPAYPQSRAGFPRLSLALWGLCGVLIIVCLAGFFDLLEFPQPVWLGMAFFAFISGAGAVLAQAPVENDRDDDGARL
ncbi:hypothetical protein [Arcanobacterium buesumense]|uniref:Uncharacterized protein n=1 Tax=Arcanobacterium buesumense TaxID=2722751 RepID=A0A6H2EKU2_9ACTO|nr:hypothetical protein [Arcanobacterium buesumense]QJC21673.1 hypothetical protein HC352_03575 [Arcanobacterium buesumense]